MWDIITLSGPICIALSFACHALESCNGVIVVTQHFFVCTVPVSCEDYLLLPTRHLLMQCPTILAPPQQMVFEDAARWHNRTFHLRQFLAHSQCPRRFCCDMWASRLCVKIVTPHHLGDHSVNFCVCSKHVHDISPNSVLSRSDCMVSKVTKLLNTKVRFSDKKPMTLALPVAFSLVFRNS